MEGKERLWYHFSVIKYFSRNKEGLSHTTTMTVKPSKEEDWEYPSF